MNIQQFSLPDVGEGLTEAEIVTWLVKCGDVVEVNQAIVEIETAKSLVELPSPFAGEVTKLHAEPGATVDVGTPIISIATGETTAAREGEVSVHTSGRGPLDEDPKLLVGYGARETTSHRRRRKTEDHAVPVVHASTGETVEPPKSTPPVRKLAKDLGLDLASITPTGAGGVRTRNDVLKASSAAGITGASETVVEAASSDGGELRIPIKGVRKHTAAAMVKSAFTAPHVTEFVTVDVSRTIELQQQISRRREFKEIKLTPLTFVAKAFLKAIKGTPEANSRWDEQAQEIVQMRKVNLGIAAATPRGLIVPNIKGAEQLPLKELAQEISLLGASARAGKTDPAAMAHGTVTVTNIGVFGIDTGTPILNPGETAILAVGTVRRMPWVVEDEHGERIEIRSVLQLALSFDHRVMDGQQGSQLLADTAAILNEPGLSLL
ncbi:2-oxo acid dehydrogenase subunit E2 [Arthrobacter sp. 24S4-2]|uniref:dihydrolipoamide acetyltransferase family protein n=1 Tax=Arthrobacter sp. 24S4-2 TaxID=2575374 RepID=UPI0010C782A2|nr:dihydrolipoamide acetyltransferase family protein [Arthrobacter sp. 24S4-2]QCO98096.1 2-oxo acid dehydrogenase subunit E2 [Arthrobacter sp. 24S4-2]